MATIAQIMDGLAQQIEGVLSSVSDVVVHVEPRTFNAAELPAIDMSLTSLTGLEGGLAGFGQQYGGIPLTFRVRVSPADIYAGEDLLLAIMDDQDPLSLTRALEYDTTVGGLIDTLGWGDGWPWTGYEAFPDPNGGGDFLGSRLTVMVVKAYT